MKKLRCWIDKHSQAELAAALGITQGAISQWFTNGFVPPKRVFKVSKITGIDPKELCPEMFSTAA
jgi:DNA-binding transcriptional regulator YdaS (Cro superfamily)